jgi:hypothetical protein
VADPVDFALEDLTLQGDKDTCEYDAQPEPASSSPKLV